MIKYANGVLRKNKKPRKGLFYFFGGGGGSCAFSGAPRSAIINGVLCRQFFSLSNDSKAKRFALAKRLPPSNPLLSVVYVTKKHPEIGCFFVGAEKRI